MKKLYTFLFQEHDIEFFRFYLAMLIPCALWKVICGIWVLVMVGVQTLIMVTHQKGWNKIC